MEIEEKDFGTGKSAYCLIQWDSDGEECKDYIALGDESNHYNDEEICFYASNLDVFKSLFNTGNGNDFHIKEILCVR